MTESLNDIRLTPRMLAALYGQSLVAPVDHTATKSAPPPASKIRILGANKRNVTILVNAPDHTFLPETEMSFLAKMLEACRMNIDDVAIVNVAVNRRPIEELFADLKPSIVLDFGQNLPGTNVFEPNTHNEITTLSAPPLGAIESDKPLKSKLWSALKQVFSI